MDLYVHSLPPLTHKFFIVKRRLDSQAGLRGFDPRLPLQKINNFEDSLVNRLFHFCSSSAKPEAP
jgi:hypothetical protein